MKHTRKQKLFIVISLFVAIASLSIGFAAFSTTLNISSSTSVNPNSDSFSVRFSSSENVLSETPIPPSAYEGGVYSFTNAVINNSGNPTLSNISVSFNQGGYIEYSVFVRNEGEYTAYLNSINFNGNKTCTPVGDTDPNLADAACEDMQIRVQIDGDSGYFPGSSDVAGYELQKNNSIKLLITILYDLPTLPDGPLAVTFPEISLIYSTVEQPGYTPSIMGSDDTPGTLVSKMKSDPMFKGTDASVGFAKTPETGVYVRNGTENNVNPIYYYRGAVTNNNVLFADKCWKIVRTTETGGIKLIYNGTPTSDNKCNGDNSMVGNSAFNDNYKTEADVSYIYSDGTNSTIKQTVDTWYTSNMTSYTDMLEDAVWCNDRSVTFDGYVSIWGYNAKFFGGRQRNVESKTPSLHCPAEYSLTTSATQASNKLTYPVGLLTADELTLAGMGWSGYKEDVYLNNYEWWWTMSPCYFANNSPIVFAASDYGGADRSPLIKKIGIRPAISLKAGTMYIKRRWNIRNSIHNRIKKTRESSLLFYVVF